MPEPRDDVRDAQRILMIAAGVGSAISEALAEVVGPDLVGNGPVVALFALDQSGTLRPGQLQELTGLSSGGVSKLLDRLQEAGLVTRDYGVLSEDRRGSVVRLTAKGRRTSRRMAEAVISRTPELRVVLKELEELVSS